MIDKLTEKAETLRVRFKPQEIKVLFVGESAPINETFFYRENSQVYRYMKKAFGEPDNFLKYFMNKGYYLDDLVLAPVNHLTKAQRRLQHKGSVSSLAQRITEYKPLVVVSIMIGISDAVEAAIEQSKQHSIVHHTVPFPGTGQQTKFLEKMALILPKLP